MCYLLIAFEVCLYMKHWHFHQIFFETEFAVSFTFLNTYCVTLFVWRLFVTKLDIALGFSLGDELGFKESLSNVESNKRRSVQGGSRLQAAAAQALQAKVVSV